MFNRLDRFKLWLMGRLTPKGYCCYLISRESKSIFESAIMVTQIAQIHCDSLRQTRDTLIALEKDTIH